VGKTTLVRSLARSNLGAGFASLDDASFLAAAHADPAGFVGNGDSALVIDEVQRIGSLASALSEVLSRRGAPGRFLLTSSVRLDSVPGFHALVREHAEVVDLWPVCGHELSALTTNIVDELFRGEPLALSEDPGAHGLLARIVAGGYPDALRRGELELRRRWFDGYLAAVIMGELADRSRELAALPHLLALIAARSGNPINVADLSRAGGVPQTTVKRWVGLLDDVFLVHHVPAWTDDIGRRLARSPRLFMVDTGLAAHLVGFPPRGGAEPRIPPHPITRVRDRNHDQPWSSTDRCGWRRSLSTP